MTPQEQFAYKLAWRPGYEVRLHSDLEYEGKIWCKRNLEAHQWSFRRYSGNYEHTFGFESEFVSQQFEHEFSQYANM